MLGCPVYVQAFPQKCISFEEDAKGFLYPSVATESCIDCGLCRKVCHCLNPFEPRMIMNVFATFNTDVEV